MYRFKGFLVFVVGVIFCKFIVWKMRDYFFIFMFLYLGMKMVEVVELGSGFNLKSVVFWV